MLRCSTCGKHPYRSPHRQLLMHSKVVLLVDPCSYIVAIVARGNEERYRIFLFTITSISRVWRFAVHRSGNVMIRTSGRSASTLYPPQLSMTNSQGPLDFSFTYAYHHCIQDLKRCSLFMNWLSTSSTLYGIKHASWKQQGDFILLESYFFHLHWCRKP